MAPPLAAVGFIRGTGDILTDADELFLGMVGYTHDDLTAGRMNWRAMTPPEWLHRDSAGMEQARRTGGYTVPYQKEFVHRMGTRVPVLLVCAFVPGTEADWVGYVVNLSPTARSAPDGAETSVPPRQTIDRELYGRLIAELVRERQRMEAMLDNSDALIWAIDTEGRLLSANRAFQNAQRHATGRALEIGESVLSPDDPEELRIPWVAWYARARAGERFTSTRAVEVDGSIVHTEHRFSPILDTDGCVVGVTVLANHVTARIQAEDALRASEERFRTLSTASPLGVFLSGVDGRCSYANPRLAAIWGVSEGELLGWGFIAGVHVDDRDRVLSDWRVAVSTGSAASLEFRVVGAAGTERHVRLRAAPIREHGTVRGFVGNVDDDTEQLALAQRLRQKEKMEALGTLAGGVAHDFNNMLGIVLGHAEIALSETGLPGSTYEHVREIQTAGARARDLVQQILTFSRGVDHDHVPVDLRALTIESVRLLRSVFPTTISLTTHIPDDPIVVLGDATALQQIIVNLCTNAEHAMRATGGGTLTVILTTAGTPPDGHALFSVQDTGTGMPADVRARAFEPFFTTKPVGEGTGIGLSVVHGLVSSYGGGLELESEVGVGTTARVALPLTTLALIQRVAVPLETRGTGSGRVLLVEDEPVLARLAERALHRAGLTVTVYHDGASALTHLDGAPDAFDVVVTDLTMPGLSGDRLVLAMRQRHLDIPVILMTGFSSTLTAGNAKSHGIDVLLEKPFSTAQLVTAVNTLLNR